jgi:hypothetical protein
MSKNSLPLKITIIVIGVLGLAFFFWAVPVIGNWIKDGNPEFSNAYIPWLILFWITAVPCYITLVILWLVVSSIDKGELFRHKNAKHFKTISLLVFIDVAVFFCTNIVFLFMDINHPSIVLASAFISLIGVAFGICMTALSEFFEKAAILQDENDLTI